MPIIRQTLRFRLESSGKVHAFYGTIYDLTRRCDGAHHQINRRTHCGREVQDVAELMEAGEKSFDTLCTLLFDGTKHERWSWRWP